MTQNVYNKSQRPSTNALGHARYSDIIMYTHAVDEFHLIWPWYDLLVHANI